MVNVYKIDSEDYDVTLKQEIRKVVPNTNTHRIAYENSEMKLEKNDRIICEAKIYLIDSTFRLVCSTYVAKKRIKDGELVLVDDKRLRFTGTIEVEVWNDKGLQSFENHVPTYVVR